MTERFTFPQHDKIPSHLPEHLPMKLVGYDDASSNVVIGGNVDSQNEPFNLERAIIDIAMGDPVANEAGMARINTSSSKTYFDSFRKLMIVQDAEQELRVYDMTGYDLPTIEVGKSWAIPGLVQSKDPVNSVLVLANYHGASGIVPPNIDLTGGIETKHVGVDNPLLSILPTFMNAEQQLMNRGLRPKD